MTDQIKISVPDTGLVSTIETERGVTPTDNPGGARLYWMQRGYRLVGKSRQTDRTVYVYAKGGEK